MIGQKFGEWEVLSYAYTNENNKIYWNPGDILYLLDYKQTSVTSIYQPQLVSDSQLELASTELYPDILYLKNHPESRAQDLKQAFLDKDIKMIITAIGGDDTYKTIPYLMEDKLKIFL